MVLIDHTAPFDVQEWMGKPRKRGAMKSWLLFLTILAPLVSARAEDGHDHFHGWYNTLTNSKNQSCCNSGDCSPSSFRIRNGEAEIEFRGAWYPLDEAAILRGVVAPDKGTHACKTSFENKPRCIVLGAGT